MGLCRLPDHVGKLREQQTGRDRVAIGAAVQLAALENELCREA
jgi:hypothetical protein